MTISKTSNAVTGIAPHSGDVPGVPFYQDGSIDTWRPMTDPEPEIYALMPGPALPGPIARRRAGQAGNGLP